jgi:hypothetical protein
MLLLSLLARSDPASLAQRQAVAASVSKKTGFGKSLANIRNGRDMFHGHGFRLGTHSKTGASCCERDRFT